MNTEFDKASYLFVDVSDQYRSLFSEFYKEFSDSLRNLFHKSLGEWHAFTWLPKGRLKELESIKFYY